MNRQLNYMCLYKKKSRKAKVQTPFPKTVRLYCYFHHDLIEKINLLREEGYRVVEKGALHEEGTGCWAVMKWYP